MSADRAREHAEAAEAMLKGANAGTYAGSLGAMMSMAQVHATLALYYVTTEDAS